MSAERISGAIFLFVAGATFAGAIVLSLSGSGSFGSATETVNAGLALAWLFGLWASFATSMIFLAAVGFSRLDAEATGHHAEMESARASEQMTAVPASRPEDSLQLAKVG